MVSAPWSLLVVDPDARVHADFRYVARTLRVKVRFVDTAEEALAACDAERPDLLMTEQRLRGVSGLELLERIHLRHPTVKRILFTAERELPKSRPMDVPVLEKPCATAALHALLEAIGQDLLRDVA